MPGWIKTDLMRITHVLGNLLRSRTRPVRSATAQQQVDQATQQLILYHFPVCPFCLRVRRVMRQLKLKIELRDAANNITYRQELKIGGGKLQTPCLKIQHPGQKEAWLYESEDIIRYLQQRFAISNKH